MLTAMLQEQARAEVKAALLGLLAAHATDETYPCGVSATFRFSEHDQDGEFQITVTHGRTEFPLSGGSL